MIEVDQYKHEEKVSLLSIFENVNLHREPTYDKNKNLSKTQVRFSSLSVYSDMIMNHGIEVTIKIKLRLFFNSESFVSSFCMLGVLLGHFIKKRNTIKNELLTKQLMSQLGICNQWMIGYRLKYNIIKTLCV